MKTFTDTIIGAICFVVPVNNNIIPLCTVSAHAPRKHRHSLLSLGYMSEHSNLTLNMWVLLLILSIVVPSLTSKEYAPLQDIPEDEKNLLFELVKRLENGGDLGQLDWKDIAVLAQCEVSTNKTSIIKKKDSLENGATFLTLYKDTENNGACSDLCCNNSSCDMAVFENKVY